MGTWRHPTLKTIIILPSANNYATIKLSNTNPGRSALAAHSQYRWHRRSSISIRSDEIGPLSRRQPVRTEIGIDGAVGVSTQNTELPTGRHFPNSGGIIGRTGDKPCAVSTETGAQHCIGMDAQHLELFARAPKRGINEKVAREPFNPGRRKNYPG